MKQFRVLFMLLIGMIGFTAMVSTPLTEQKQKIEIVKDFQVQAIADNVLSFELVSVDPGANFLQSNEAHIFRIVTEPVNTLDIITDVGWHSSKQILINTNQKIYAMETPTLGQKRVQRNFNPSANAQVEDLKEAYSKLIDVLESNRNERNGREISIAQTEAETSCMYAVKALFV
jgi:hypothetical protein